MGKTRNQSAGKKGIFSIILVIIAALFLYSLLYVPSALFDVAVAIGFFAILYYYDKKTNPSIGAVLLLSLAILLSPLGLLFSLYSYFVIGVVGYDKLIHFVGGFAIVYALSQNFPEKRTVLRYTIIVLILLGLGTIIEINEFVGFRYFGVDNGGIFTMSDTLPEIKSDLQKYDTYFDMIFNLGGALSAVLFVVFRKKYWQSKG